MRYFGLLNNGEPEGFADAIITSADVDRSA